MPRRPADSCWSIGTDDRIRIVVVTSGTGASTAFAIAEETVAELFGVTAC
jgi:hypothetical protein